MSCATSTPRRPASRVVLLGAALAALAGGCQPRDQFSASQLLGGQQVPAAVLNGGALNYRRYCSGCHGPRGDGRSPNAESMKPPPRDFTRGIFKFASVRAGGLPTDDDLTRTIRRGLKGTHMSGWGAIAATDARSLVQYLKTFSPRWRAEQPGTPIAVPPDPWSSEAAQGVRRGEVVYHAVARCWQCHPAYKTADEIRALVRAELERSGKPSPKAIPFRGTLERSVNVPCSFGNILPPDFLQDTLRAYDEPNDIYRTVAAGIGGTPMPSWNSELPAADVWAVTRYVAELVRVMGTPEAERYRPRRR